MDTLFKEDLSSMQFSEISRLLDERYIYLQLRMKRLKPFFDKKPSILLDVEREMDVIDSLNELLWK